MKEIEQVHKHAVDLYWLAFLLTGHREVSADIAAETIASQDSASPFFSNWIEAWARRIVIARALDTIRDGLAASARRTELNHADVSELPERDWALDSDTKKVEIEKALLAIDVFPRASLLLLVFERMSLTDVTVLLNADEAAIRKAQVVALRELTSNLARMQGWKPSAAEPPFADSDAQRV